MTIYQKVLAVAGLTALLAGPLASPSRADHLYGVTFFDNQLITVDTTNGTGSLVGPLDTPMMPFGLAAVNGQLYTFDSNADLIRQINPGTGATLASYNIGIGPVLGQGGLAFQTATVGYLTSALDPASLNVVNDLYRFDISSGTSTLIAHTAVTLESIAFAPDGTLYGLGKLDGDLYTVDPTTGATTLVGNTGVAIGSPIGALTVSPGGQLYASLNDVLYTLNPMTGLATPVNPDPSVGIGFSSVSGLAFAPSPVPEPSSLLQVGLALGGTCLMLARRRLGRPARGHSEGPPIV